MKAVEALALVGGYVDEELLIRNEYLVAENEILKSKIEKPVQFKDDERILLAKIGKRLGFKALKEFDSHYHEERNHQGKGNAILFPSTGSNQENRPGEILCNQRLNGMLKYYYRDAA